MGFVIYLISILDGVFIILALLTFLLISFSMAYPLICFSNDETPKKRLWLTSLIIGVFVAFLSVLIPSSKAAAAIYVIPKIVENERVQKIGGGLMDTAEAWLKELSPSGVVKQVTGDE